MRIPDLISEIHQNKGIHPIIHINITKFQNVKYTLLTLNNMENLCILYININTEKDVSENFSFCIPYIQYNLVIPVQRMPSSEGFVHLIVFIYIFEYISIFTCILYTSEIKYI